MKQRFSNTKKTFVLDIEKCPNYISIIPYNLEENCLRGEFNFDNRKVWALFGKTNDKDSYECLQVGASINGIKDEIADCVEIMNSSEEIEFCKSKNDGININTTFYIDAYLIPNQYINNKRKYCYKLIKSQYPDLVFVAIDIDKYLNIEIMNKFEGQGDMFDIVNMITISKMNYAEAKFAFEAQAKYWNAFRSGIDMKTVNILLNNN